MEPRRLKAILQLPANRRFDLIAEGLEALTRQVARLYEDAKHLERLERPHGAGIVEAFYLEEAAKVLILLDLVRTDPRNGKAWSTQISWFYSHLARCLYASAYQGSPASLGEVRGYINSLRESHYLDGPNDVDWIFRNQPISERERVLYVDLVEAGDDLIWWGPGENPMCWVSSRLPELVSSLASMGITSRGGLDVVSAAWKDVPIDDSMLWSEVRRMNGQVLESMIEGKLYDEASATKDDFSTVLNHWIFPLRTLDLSEKKVSVEELKQKRQRVLEQYLYEEWGYP
ncbi:hypothetical protein O7607_03770 [Micromonospora sp. WMMA1949]|uniref:hypothetical protein n=1 Tax=Micromonospora sp. WMMA1949 TaxID=3015162 RepID=UPI0022B6BB34|nr:hypothetical protein [Micromonospora sp. WMMA1949]MCZ7424844.1 hypothetical protein [Micromonospora sp. WMMA1949]